MGKRATRPVFTRREKALRGTTGAAFEEPPRGTKGSAPGTRPSRTGIKWLNVQKANMNILIKRVFKEKFLKRLPTEIWTTRESSVRPPQPRGPRARAACAVLTRPPHPRPCPCPHSPARKRPRRARGPRAFPHSRGRRAARATAAVTSSEPLTGLRPPAGLSPAPTPQASDGSESLRQAAESRAEPEPTDRQTDFGTPLRPSAGPSGRAAADAWGFKQHNKREKPGVPQGEESALLSSPRGVLTNADYVRSHEALSQVSQREPRRGGKVIFLPPF